jgi:hypothetical protein
MDCRRPVATDFVDKLWCFQHSKTLIHFHHLKWSEADAGPRHVDQSVLFDEFSLEGH